MNSDHIAIIWIVAFRSLGVVAAVISAAFLAYHDKPGWEWLLIVSVLLAQGNIELNRGTNNEQS